MKIILVGLLITILAVQQSSSNQDQHSEQTPLNSLDDMEKLVKQFKNFDRNLGRVEDKLEALHNTMLAENKSKELSKLDKIGSKYYHIEHREKHSWLDAFHKCRSMGLNLAVPQNRKELSAVSGKLTHDNYWLDMTECVNLAKTDLKYVMNYEDCDSKFNYICEKDDWEVGRVTENL